MILSVVCEAQPREKIGNLNEMCAVDLNKLDTTKSSLWISRFMKEIYWFSALRFGLKFLVATLSSPRCVNALMNTLLCYLQVC